MILETINKHYAKAVDSHQFVRHVYDVLCRDYRIAPSNIMLAHSVCSDDVINIEYPEEGRQMLGPFNLGGLNGYPFVGLTGMGAFSKHIPEEGAALIFYAPHIGAGESGEVGKILRVGQSQPSACCGAAAAALQKLEQNEIFTGGAKNELDFQQQTLEEIVWRERERILSAENRLKAVTEAIYEASEKTINILIEKTAFTGKYVFVVGAIIINSDWQHGAFLELRRFDCLNAETKKIINGHL